MVDAIGISMEYQCQKTSSGSVLRREIILSHDALIDKLSGSVETTATGTVIYRNAAGKSHRIGGPAIIYATGEEHWHQNGKLHRIDGPAVVYADGSRAWCQNDRLHRTDGPAVIHADGDVYWFLNDMRLSEEEFNRRIASGDYHEP